MANALTIAMLGLFSLVGDGLEFDSYSWDFGKILEKDGIVSHTFVMTNATNHDIQITNAIPSCSCTWVTFPKEVIKPGQEAKIEVKYTPTGAMGKVFREIEVYDYDNKCIATLEVSADVEPADRSIPERYPFPLAPFFYTSLNNVPFGYVYHGTEKNKIVYLANSSEKLLQIEAINTNDKLTLQYPKVLQPGEEAELSMTYSTPLQPDYFEYITDTLYFKVNGERSLMPIVTSMLALSKVEDSATSPTLRTYPSAPRLKKRGKVFVTQVDLYNDGQDDLLINAVQLPDFATTDLRRGEHIASGKKKVVKVRSLVEEEFMIRLFTNDPTRPMKEIRTTPALKK